MSWLSTGVRRGSAGLSGDIRLSRSAGRSGCRSGDGCGAAADHELHWIRGRTRYLFAAHQSAHRGADGVSALAQGLGDSRQRRVGGVGRRRVVEPHHGQSVRDRDAGTMGGAQGAQGKLVAEGEDGGRALGTGEQLRGTERTGVRVIGGALHDRHLRPGDAGLRGGGAETPPAHCTDDTRRWAAVAESILPLTLPDRRPRREIAPGAVHVPGWLSIEQQRRLVVACRGWAAGAVPIRAARLPGGHVMSVRTVCLGWHWQPYRYTRTADDAGGGRVVKLPDWLAELGRAAVLDAYGDPAAGRDYRPDTVLINYYDDSARMGMHRDKDEKVDAPVVSLSIGDTALFRFGNTTNRGQPYTDVALVSGDLFVFGGPSRFAFHGVPKVYPGTCLLYTSDAADDLLCVDL